MDIARLGRAETAAVITGVLAEHGIDVVLVGGSCVCVWTSERFVSFDLDFIDLTYARRKRIADAMATIGFLPRARTRYFEHPDSPWSVEFPTAPLAIGHEEIGSERLAEMHTGVGVIRLLNPTDSIKDRLLWWYLEKDRQCLQQALDLAQTHSVDWADLERWHQAEGYSEEYLDFQRSVSA